MYRIGEFSKINKVTIKTLRYYEKVGLLKPAFVDNENGYRYYISEQLPVLHKIIALRQMDFSISEILSVLKTKDTVDIFQKKKNSLLNDIEKKREQLTQIRHYLEKNKEGFKMNYQVVLKELPEVIVYSKKMRIPDYDYYFQIIPKIGEKVMKANPGLECSQPEYCFIVYLDGEYKKKDFSVEFCEAVTSLGNEIEDIKFKKIEKVPTAACVYHQGPYSTIGEAYAHLFKWIDDNGYQPSDNPRESVINGIWNKEDESEWLTELQIPVIKK